MAKYSAELKTHKKILRWVGVCNLLALSILNLFIRISFDFF